MVLDQTCRESEEHGQDPGSKGVERPAVTDALGAGQSRRTRPTTSCDVGPGGLLMIRTPSMPRSEPAMRSALDRGHERRGRRQEHPARFVERPRQGRAGRASVAAAAELTR